MRASAQRRIRPSCNVGMCNSLCNPLALHRRFVSHGLKTAAELKRLIQARMNALDDVEEDGEQVFAHDVDWHEPDESGCNWNMSGYRGPANYATDIRRIVNNLRREYRLSHYPARYDGS